MGDTNGRTTPLIDGDQESDGAIAKHWASEQRLWRNQDRESRSLSMNIIMFTNTFTPQVGGVSKSVAGLTQGLRDSGHRVLVVAPVFANMPGKELDVVRIPSLP